MCAIFQANHQFAQAQSYQVHRNEIQVLGATHW